jgi:hypothetical protein
MNISKLTEHTVVIEGNKVQVAQSESGRFYATVRDNENTAREWHAMDLQTLQQRIDRTTEDKP